MKITKENLVSRVIIHYPNKWLLNQFCHNSIKRKIVWNRENNDPSLIALNEWPRVKILNIIIGVPFIALVVLSFIPALLLMIFLHFIEKDKSEFIHQEYFNVLNWLAKNERSAYRNVFFDLAKNLISPPKYTGLLRVLYIEKGSEEILLKIDSKRKNDFIDEIWLYDNLESAIREVVYKDFLLNQSFITTYNEANDLCEIEWLHESNNMIKAERERLELNKKLVEKSKEPQHPKITLNANNFLNNDVVLYFESSYNEKINDFILKNYDYIKERLHKKSLHFIYIPQNIFKNKNPYIELVDYASYLHPESFSISEQEKVFLLDSILNNVDVDLFYKGIAAALNIPEMQHPVLLHSVDLSTGINPHRNYLYSVYDLKGQDDDAFGIEIEYYLNVVSIAAEPNYRRVAPDYEDPDEMFPSHGEEIGRDLKKSIDSLIKFNNEKLILSSIIYMINSLKETQPQLCEKINKTLYDTISKQKTPLSRLYIDERYKIFLADYNNIEIELTPLPKTLFIFMLKNPEGVRLKELSNHREELIKIYSRIGNRLDMEQVKKSIIDLTDARLNSVNEKCSRIKEAFLSKIDDSVAQHYYITGNRSDNKRILIDRSLVIFSDSK